MVLRYNLILLQNSDNNKNIYYNIFYNNSYNTYLFKNLVVVNWPLKILEVNLKLLWSFNIGRKMKYVLYC